MEKNVLVPVVLFSVLFLVVGFGAGFFVEKQMLAEQSKSVEKIQNTFEDLRTPQIIRSITAMGVINKIEGREITLDANGEALKVTIKEDAEIYLPPQQASPSETMLVYRQAEITALKVGDILTIDLNILPDGQLIGVKVNVIPPQTGGASK